MAWIHRRQHNNTTHHNHHPRQTIDITVTPVKPATAAVSVTVAASTHHLRHIVVTNNDHPGSTIDTVVTTTTVKVTATAIEIAIDSISDTTQTNFTDDRWRLETGWFAVTHSDSLQCLATYFHIKYHCCCRRTFVYARLEREYTGQHVSQNIVYWCPLMDGYKDAYSGFRKQGFCDCDQ